MYAEVLVRLDARDFRFDLRAEDAMSQDAARTWMDEQVVALKCEPLRASGKLLRADKVVVVAREAGVDRFGEVAWGTAFSAATVALLGKTLVQIDADNMTVTY